MTNAIKPAGFQATTSNTTLAKTKTTKARLDEIKIGDRHRRDLGDIDGLAASMATDGLLHPIVITPDGRLIAGERRLRAAQQIGWPKIPVTVVDLADIVRGEYAENTFRKDFSLSEAVSIKRSLEPIERAEAQKRMCAGRPLENFSKGSGGRALDKIAKITGVHRTTLAKAEAIVEAAEAEPKKFGKLLEEMDRTGRANGPYRRLKNTQQAEAIRAEPPPLPGRGPYYVGQIDIPWAYEPDDEDAPERGALPYPTLSIEQACALDVGSIMHKDSILWMWVTNFILVRGLHLPVLEEWGFVPKAIVTWPKDRVNARAHWAKGQTEHMVMAVRGKPVVTLTDQTTLLKGPFHLVQKGVHSAKPVEAYTFIESLCPAPLYADFFSRYRHNDKWDCHGDQAPTDTDTAVPPTTAPAAPAQPMSVAMLNRREKLGDDVFDRIKSTTLGTAREMDELLILNRGAQPGELTEVVRQLVSDAVAGKPVSARALHFGPAAPAPAPQAPQPPNASAGETIGPLDLRETERPNIPNYMIRRDEAAS